jgi:hypothetical protein
MTTRRLEQRPVEHSKDGNSALFKYSSLTGHSINFNDPEIIIKDDVK